MGDLKPVLSLSSHDLISLPEKCQSVNRQQSLTFLLGGAKQSKVGDDGEACEWWRNLWNSASVLTSRICKVWYLFSEKFIFALATEVWTFRSQWLPNIFLCVQGCPRPECATLKKTVGSQGCILLNLGDGLALDPGNGSGLEQGSFLLVWVFLYGMGLNFDKTEMTYINIQQRIKD